MRKKPYLNILTQKNYHQTDSSLFDIGSTLIQDNEPLAFHVCKKIDQYICKKIDIEVDTDHKPIIDILRKPLVETLNRTQCDSDLT